MRYPLRRMLFIVAVLTLLSFPLIGTGCNADQIAAARTRIVQVEQGIAVATEAVDAAKATRPEKEKGKEKGTFYFFLYSFQLFLQYQKEIRNWVFVLRHIRCLWKCFMRRRVMGRLRGEKK